MTKKTNIFAVMILLLITILCISISSATKITLQSEGRAVTTVYEDGSYKTECDNSQVNDCTITIYPDTDN